MKDNKNSKHILFGRKPVIEALEAGKALDKILVANGSDADLLPALRKIAKPGTFFQKVPKAKLDKITRKNHQGVVAFASLINYYRVDDVLAQAYEQGETPLFLALDSVTDIGNFGAICRSAYALGVHGVIIPQKGSAQINPIAIKASAGALHYIRVCKVESLKQTLGNLQKVGVSVVATSLTLADKMESIDLSTPLCLVMGNEEKGVGSQICEMADSCLYIPMQKEFDSLNVSVATGIVLYEVNRQRKT